MLLGALISMVCHQSCLAFCSAFSQFIEWLVYFYLGACLCSVLSFLCYFYYSGGMCACVKWIGLCPVYQQDCPLLVNYISLFSNYIFPIGTKSPENVFFFFFLNSLFSLFIFLLNLTPPPFCFKWQSHFWEEMSFYFLIAKISNMLFQSQNGLKKNICCYLLVRWSVNCEYLNCLSLCHILQSLLLCVSVTVINLRVLLKLFT